MLAARGVEVSDMALFGAILEIRSRFRLEKKLDLIIKLLSVPRV